MICTDSQSLSMAMKSLNPETDGIREALQHHSGSIVIQWIPGHSNIPGNNLADDAAKKGNKSTGGAKTSHLPQCLYADKKNLH